MLPKAQRDDIVAELSEEIRAQMAEREALLGRPLDEAEADAVLAGYGHPMLVGGRYQPAQGSLAFGRELIGPELFPFYVGTMRFTFAVSTAIQVAIMGALSFWERLTFGEVANAFALHYAIQFAVLTLVFCGLQVQVTRRPNEWDSRRAIPERKPTAASIRCESVAEFVVLVLALRVLLGMRGASEASLGAVRLAPVWDAAFLPILAATLATMAQALAIAFRPDGVRFRRPVRAAALAVWLGVVAYLLGSGPWVVASGSRAPEGLGWLNDVAFHNGLLVALASFAGAFAWEAAGLWRERAEASRAA